MCEAFSILIGRYKLYGLFTLAVVLGGLTDIAADRTANTADRS